MPIRVMIVDDHRIVRDGLEQLIRSTDDLELVATAADGQEAIDRAALFVPDVVLMDLSMPVLDGIAATKVLRQAYPDLRIVVLTSYSEQARIVDAFDAGADGYLLKHAEPTQILEAIRAAVSGGVPLDPQVARELLTARRALARAGGNFRPRTRGVVAGRRRPGQQADLPSAGHHRTNGQGAPDQHLSTHWGDRPYPGGVVGPGSPVTIRDDQM